MSHIENLSAQPYCRFCCNGAAMSFTRIGEWQIHDPAGRRKYVTEAERRAFLGVADHLAPRWRGLCYVLAYTGCRISEALSLAGHQLDPDAGTITFRTLKRRRPVFRRVPVPRRLITMLLALPPRPDGQLWCAHRVTAWRHVSRAMALAGIDGPMASCKGLRHGFGLRAAAAGVPPNLIAKWLGHASLTTTAIYLDLVGVEERMFAERMW